MMSELLEKDDLKSECCTGTSESIIDTFIAGYIGTKYLREHQCSICPSLLLKPIQAITNNNEILTLIKAQFEKEGSDVGGLTLPSDVHLTNGRHLLLIFQN